MPGGAGRIVALLCRVQAAALVVLAVLLVGLALSARWSVPAGFLVADVLAALAVAALLALAPGRRRARGPVLLLELLAVAVGGQLLAGGRPLIGGVVGVPAAVAVGLLIAGYRS